MFSLRPLIFAALLASVIAESGDAAAPPRRMPAKAPARNIPAKAPPPTVRPALSPPLTMVSLATALRAAGYEPAPSGRYQRLKIDEGEFGYSVDLGLSDSGDWLVCMAHLAPIEDLTKVPSAPLLSLLATNDGLLGMYFSYNRPTGQVMLNAAVPNRGLTAVSLRNLLDGLKKTVRETRGLWDPQKW